MGMAGTHRASSSATPRKHRYRLHYQANAHGIAKQIEMNASQITEAIEFALSDPLARAIDVWEDGEFACRISREARLDETRLHN